MTPRLEPDRHNLPAETTRFVGRERDTAELAALLPAERLVTLTGVGGIGKTRLARQVAAGTLGAFEDGVWLVPLADVHDPALVPQAVAAVLGVAEEPGRSQAGRWWRRSPRAARCSCWTTASTWWTRARRSRNGCSPAARACTCWRRAGSRCGCRARWCGGCRRWRAARRCGCSRTGPRPCGRTSG
ncbi:hypothetical protein ACFQU9_37225 [Actinomadura namibiensis]|uniref:hypothetical protein n=1 Tax=Actinomadura kijaniata TaxID=46161 RepID=UPI003612AAAD